MLQNTVYEYVLITEKVQSMCPIVCFGILMGDLDDTSFAYDCCMQLPYSALLKPFKK